MQREDSWKLEDREGISAYCTLYPGVYAQHTPPQANTDTWAREAVCYRQPQVTGVTCQLYSCALLKGFGRNVFLLEAQPTSSSLTHFGYQENFFSLTRDSNNFLSSEFQNTASYNLHRIRF